LAASGARFVEIAGNKIIVATVIVPIGWDGARLWSGAVGRWPVLSEASSSSPPKMTLVIPSPPG